MLVVFPVTLNVANALGSANVPRASVASVAEGGTDQFVDS